MGRGACGKRDKAEGGPKEGLLDRPEIGTTTASEEKNLEVVALEWVRRDWGSSWGLNV